MEWLADPNAWVALFTLTLLEIVLGIDNIIFISIISDRLPPKQKKCARFVGLSLAMIMRIGLLASLTWLTKLTAPLFSVLSHDISGRDLILILGGLFLLVKSTLEIHNSLEGEEKHTKNVKTLTLSSAIIQIILLDIVFSLDSVITAIGMTKQLMIMVLAVIIAVIFMIIFAGSISRFVEKHPTFKMLALSFLFMIGLALLADGFAFHIPKGYLYFAMAFSICVEMLNMRLRKTKVKPVHLRSNYDSNREADIYKD